MKTLLCLLLLLPIAVLAQDAPPQEDTSPLADIEFLLGKWKGFGKGRWGNSMVERTYEWVLDSSFVMAKNKSVYEPQEKNAEGETHENWDYFSYDGEREKIVIRSFHNEHIVNTFVLDSISDGGNTLVFTTEHVENFMPGWRARLTFQRLGNDSFKEIFELGGPDAEFKVFLENNFLRR